MATVKAQMTLFDYSDIEVLEVLEVLGDLERLFCSGTG